MERLTKVDIRVENAIWVLERLIKCILVFVLRVEMD